jgi:hypothetical protein
MGGLPARHGSREQECAVVDLGSIWRGAAGLAVVALRSFLGTLLVLSVVGALLAAASAYFLRHQPLYASIAAAVAVAESVTAGILLGGKRAIVMTLVHGLVSLKLGRATVRLVFERLLGVTDSQEFGNRGGALAQVAERLPLAQAESCLTATVNQMLADPASASAGGWFRRQAQARLFRTMQRYTLARFREEGAQYGGVDLVKVRDELEATADSHLVSKLRGGLNLWTALVILGLPAAVFAQTYLLIALLNAK